MRDDFVTAMCSHFAADPRAIFITGDLGFRALEPLRDAFPQRFINAGIAEQNMVGMAAGLALSGLRPWVYSIATFAVFRCFEQIRNDLCLHRLPVRIVGNGGGFTYGVMGSTHHALEDLGTLKTLPGLSLIFPCHREQVGRAVDCAAAQPGPCYLRLAHPARPMPSSPTYEHPATLTRQHGHGGRLTVIAVGHAEQLALAALAPLSAGIAIFGLARFPLDRLADRRLAVSIARTRCVLFIDEHYATGSIAESIAAMLPVGTHHATLAVPHETPKGYGSAAFHLDSAGLNVVAVRRAATALMATVSGAATRAASGTA